MSKLISLAEGFLRHLFRALNQLKKMDTQSRIAVFVTVMLFLPFFLGALGMASAAVYALSKSGLRKKIMTGRGTYLLYAFCLLTFVVSLCYMNWRGILGGVAIFLLFTYGLFLRVIMTEKLYHYLIKIICGLSVLSSLYAMTQMWHIWPLTTDYRAYSTFFNPNYYATIAGFVILLCVYKLSCFKGGRLFYFICMLFNLVGVVSTGCRTAWLALGVGVVAMLFFQKRYKWMVGIAVLGAAVLVIGIVQPDWIPRFDSIGYSATDRFRIWESGASVLPDSLWVGKGLYTYYYSVLHQTVDFMVNKPHSHNLYLDFLLNFGIVGCAMLLIVLAGLIRAVAIKVRRGCPSRVWTVMAGIFIGILVHGITDVTILGVETSIMMVTLFSGVGIYENYKVPKQTPVLAE